MTDYTITEFRTTKELVKKLMQQSERCRNDDKFLTFRVCEEIAKKNGQKIFIPFSLFEKLPAFETVKRVRAVIQNVDGELLPTDPYVVEKRRQKQHTLQAALARREI